jgi:DNA-binding response OmpR family regulator
MDDRIKVLLVEDEQTLAMIVKDTLDEEGFDVSLACDGNKGLDCFFIQRPDIVIADVMMPGLDGFELVRKIRQTDKLIPILFLTARSAVKDVIKGFELGANDYLKKPFNMQELIVRIKALVGRFQIKLEKESIAVFEIGSYIFNPVNQTLLYSNIGDTLSHRESEILKYLCLNKGNIVETQNILLELWGDDSFFNTKSLHVFITKIRNKLSKDKRVKIINIRGIGYKLIE